MGRRQRVSDLESKSGGSGRYFALFQQWDGSGRWRVGADGPVLTWAEFLERYKPTDRDHVVQVCYTDDWRGRDERGLTWGKENE